MIKSKAFFANLNTKIEWFKKRIIKKTYNYRYYFNKYICFNKNFFNLIYLLAPFSYWFTITI